MEKMTWFLNLLLGMIGLMSKKQRDYKMLIYVISVLVTLIAVFIMVIISWTSPVIRLEHFASLATIIAAMAAVGALIVASIEYFSKKKKDREDSRPYVVVALQPSQASFNLFDVVIENIGKSAAKDISIKFSPNHTFSGTKKKINDIKIMKNLHFMPPGNRLNFYFGSAAIGEKAENSIRKKYNVIVKYTDVNGISYSEDFVCDPTDYDGMSILEIKTVHHLAKYVEALSKHVEDASGSQKRLTETIAKEGIRIRNNHTLPADPYAYLNMIVAILRLPSENEFWLKPFVYDFILLLKQARDSVAAKQTLSDNDKIVIEDLNKIISIDHDEWSYKKEELDGYLNDLVQHYDILMSAALNN